MTDLQQYLRPQDPDEGSPLDDKVEEIELQPASPGSHFEPEIEMLQEARKEWDSGDYTQAVQSYEFVLEKYPQKFPKDDLVELALQIAEIHYELGNYDAAKKASNLAVNSAQMSKQRDRANQILGRVAVAEYRFADAENYFAAMTKDSKHRLNPGTLLGRIQMHLKCRQTKKAYAVLQDLEKYHINSDTVRPTLSSKNPEYLVYKAYIELLMGNERRALNSARELVPRCHKNVHLLAILAEIFLTASQYQESERVADEVLRRCPKNDQALAIKAHLSYAKQDFGAARNYASKACESNTRNFYAQIIFVQLAARDERYVEAENMGKKILLECPEFALMHAVLGDIYFDQDKGKEALLHYRHTNDLMAAPTKGGHLRQARMHMILGEYREAVKILEPLVEVTHTYSDEAMTDLLVCYDVMNETEKAKSLWEKMEIRKAFYHRMGRVMEMVSKGKDGAKAA
jgi:tetratricopeptide (TPR) repeat protein